MANRATVKQSFETGDQPTQAEFEQLIDSAYFPDDDGAPAPQSHTHPQSDVTGLESALSSLGSLASGNQSAINDLYAKGRTFAGTITADRQIMVTYARQNAYDGPVTLAASGNTNGCTFKVEFDQPTQATLDAIAAEADLILREGSPTPDITKLNVLVGYIQGNKGYYTWAVFESEYTPPDEDAPVLTFNPANGATDIAVDVSPTITANEPIELVGGGEITSGAVLEGLLTVKEDNGSGADIPFTATIDGAKQVITIDITSDLPNSQAVYVAIDPVQDAAGNQTGNQSATFTSVAAASGESLNISSGGIYRAQTFDATGSDLTFGGFVKMSSLPSGILQGVTLLFAGGNSPASRVLTLRVIDNGYIEVRMLSAGGELVETFQTAIPLNTWRHAAARFNSGGNTIDIFANGSLVASVSNNTGTYNGIGTSAQLKVGVYGTNITDASNALVDEVFLIKSALTNQQISDIAAKILDPSTLSPYVMFPFDGSSLVSTGTWTGAMSQEGTVSFSSDVP